MAIKITKIPKYDKIYTMVYLLIVIYFQKLVKMLNLKDFNNFMNLIRKKLIFI